MCTRFANLISYKRWVPIRFTMGPHICFICIWPYMVGWDMLLWMNTEYIWLRKPRCIDQEVISTASSASAWRQPEEFSIAEQLFVGIYLAFCLSCYTLRNIKINKSQNPRYLALAYLPHRQWMNYTTNRTLRLQSIHCPLRGKLI